jgi:hypothetical protein
VGGAQPPVNAESGVLCTVSDPSSRRSRIVNKRANIGSLLVVSNDNCATSVTPSCQIMNAVAEATGVSVVTAS